MQIDKTILAFYKRRNKRLLQRGIRLDADEENNAPKKNHGNTRLPYGLAKGEGIETEGMKPREVWEALEGKGYNPKESYKGLKEGKSGKELKTGSLEKEEFKYSEFRKKKTALKNATRKVELLKADKENLASSERAYKGRIRSMAGMMNPLTGEVMEDKEYSSEELKEMVDAAYKDMSHYPSSFTGALTMARAYMRSIERLREEIGRIKGAEEEYDRAKKDYDSYKQSQDSPETVAKRKEIKATISEYESVSKDYEKSERAVESAKDKLGSAEREKVRAEERKKFIGGRTREEVQKTLDELPEEFKEYKRKANLYYAEFGSEDRKEIEEKFNGSRYKFNEFYENKIRLEYPKEDDTSRECSKVLSYIRDYGEDGGYDKAVQEYDRLNKRVEKANQKFEEAKSKIGGLKKRIDEGIKTAFPRIADCETNAEITMRFNAEDYFGGKESNFEGISDAFTYDLACEMEYMFDRFPKLRGHMKSMTCEKGTGMRGKIYAQSSRVGVEMNPKWFRDDGEFEKSWASDLRGEFHPPNTGKEAIIIHEYGHQLDDYFTSVFKDEIMDEFGLGVKFSTVVCDKAMKKYAEKHGPINKVEFKKLVSQYAFKNKSGGDKEFLAEAFSEGVCSDEPREIAQYVMEIVEEYHKKL